MIQKIRNGELRLPAPEPWESRLLDAYRLSDEYRAAFAEQLWSYERDGALMKYAVRELKKRLRLGEDEPLELEEHRALLTDLAYSCAVLGYRGWEYFSYHFEDRSVADRLSFFPESKYTQYFSLLNDQSLFALFDNKYSTWLALKPYYKRDVLSAASPEDYPAFAAFYEAHGRFLVKPVTGTFGKGIRAVGRLASDEEPRAVFDELIREGPFLCEELIASHPELARIHPQSLNTLRVFTWYDPAYGEGPEILCAMLKAGVGDAVVDNISAGGISAIVDPRSGLVTTAAANEAGDFYELHPDTGFRFRGFRIPYWEACRDFCARLAAEFPTMRLIGWDIALNDANEWVVVEGNPRGMFNALQTPAAEGMRDFFLRGFHWERFGGSGSFSVFAKGTSFRDRVKALAGGSENVRAVRRAASLPAELRLTEKNTVSDSSSPEPVYAWFREGTLYYFTKAETLYLAVNPSAMFQNLSALEELDLSGLRSSHSIYFDYMFYGCSKLRSLDLSALDTGKSHRMNAMFCGCESLERVELGAADTANVKNMSRMFSGCRSLKELDVSGFDTSQVENMSAMFAGCEKLERLDLSRFDVSRVTDMRGMFRGCAALRSVGTPGFAVSGQTQTQDMFAGCAVLSDGRAPRSED